jgi:predicted nuclease with TOPRIM domain
MATAITTTHDNIELQASTKPVVVPWKKDYLAAAEKHATVELAKELKSHRAALSKKRQQLRHTQKMREEYRLKEELQEPEPELASLKRKFDALEQQGAEKLEAILQKVERDMESFERKEKQGRMRFDSPSANTRVRQHNSDDDVECTAAKSLDDVLPEREEAARAVGAIIAVN